MAHHSEKFLVLPPGFHATLPNDTLEPCFPYFPPCPDPDLSLPPPPPPPLPIPPNFVDKQSRQLLSPLVIIIVAILISAFLLVSYYAVIVKYFSNRRNPSGSAAPPTETHEDLDQTPNPMDLFWCIRTVGLDESVINSITVCKYKRGDGLIEGTECSVCLNEFREDEDLRLLPKCSHAFHLPCIDTWLKSHVNCPLCRASVVSNPASSPSMEPASISSDSVEEARLGNSQSRAELGSSRRTGVFGSQNFGDVDAAELGDLSSPHVNCGFRAQSDLIDNHRSRDSAIAVMDDDIQPVRRSISMDSSAAAMILISMANLHSMGSEGSSTTIEGHLTGPKKSNLGESSGVKRIVPKQGWNQGILKTVGNCSKRALLQKAPILMKRSFSGSGKFFLTRYGRSRNAVLPL